MIKNLIRVYEKVEDLVACIGLICGVGIMFVGVVARYVFGHPLTFVDEIGPIFIVWSTLAGSIRLLFSQEIMHITHGKTTYLPIISAFSGFETRPAFLRPP